MRGHTHIIIFPFFLLATILSELIQNSKDLQPVPREMFEFALWITGSSSGYIGADLLFPGVNCSVSRLDAVLGGARKGITDLILISEWFTKSSILFTSILYVLPGRQLLLYIRSYLIPTWV